MFLKDLDWSTDNQAAFLFYISHWGILLLFYCYWVILNIYYLKKSEIIYNCCFSLFKAKTFDICAFESFMCVKNIRGPPHLPCCCQPLLHFLSDLQEALNSAGGAGVGGSVKVKQRSSWRVWAFTEQSLSWSNSTRHRLSVLLRVCLCNGASWGGGAATQIMLDCSEDTTALFRVDALSTETVFLFFTHMRTKRQTANMWLQHSWSTYLRFKVPFSAI